jgi:hypothetical protein
MKQNWTYSIQLEHDFARVLVGQKKRGFLLDKPLVEKHIETLSTYIDKIDEEVQPQLPLLVEPLSKKSKGVFPYVKKPFVKSGGYSAPVSNWIEIAYASQDPGVCGPFTRVSYTPVDINSGAQMKDFLLSEGWVPDKWNYNKETKARTSPILSSDDDFIGVRGKVGQQVAKRAKYRHRRSQLEGFLKRVRTDGRITADVSGMCPTARLKHSGVVNVPGGEALFGNEMREIFIVPKGYKLVGCDAASCQLRDLCHYMGDADYTEAVVNGDKAKGTDIHSVNMRKAGLKTRAEGKTFIYAFLFGAGDPKLAGQLGCSVKDVKKMRKRFLENLPKLDQLVKSIKKVWKERGFLYGIDGRKIFIRSEHMLLVYLLQSAEAIMMKLATVIADREIRAVGLDAQMIAHVHDEFQWEVREDQAEEVAGILEYSIAEAGRQLNLNVPMAGEADIGNSWRDTH